MICEEVQKCAEVESEIKDFTKKATEIIYGQSKKTAGDKLVAGYYAELNEAFRQWLYSIEPESDPNEKRTEWEKTAYAAAIAEVDAFMEFLGNAAYRQRVIDKTKKAKPKSVFDLLGWYKYDVRKIYQKKKEETA